MIRASTLRPIFIAGVALMATLLAACGDNNGGLVNSATPPTSDFKPVPVSPIIGDVVLGNKDAKIELVEYAALTCHVCRDFAKQIFPRLKAAYIDTCKVTSTCDCIANLITECKYPVSHWEVDDG